MRKIVVISMISLDGVLQAPGGPDEDTSGGFTLGGWTSGFGDEVFGAALIDEMRPSDLLLGRVTFDIWEPYWPANADAWPGINEMTKFVVSTTRDTSEWSNSVFLDGIDDIRSLKETDGSNLHVWGSANLAQALFENDLVDELWLKIYPVTLGSGKKLFQAGTIPAAFTLLSAVGTPSGVILANYARAGEIETGSVGP